MRILILCILFLFSASSSFAQAVLRGTNVDDRTVLSFKVADELAQSLLPDGWRLNSPTSGAAPGYNVAISLIEGLVNQDAHGTLLPAFRGYVISVPAKRRDGAGAGNMIITGVTNSASAPGAYGVYVQGNAAIERKKSTTSDGSVRIQESWRIATAGESALSVELDYVVKNWRKRYVETNNYSSKTPEFFRSYKQDEVMSIVRGDGVPDQITGFSLKVTDERLRRIFDSNEKLIYFAATPRYARQVFHQ